VLSPLLERGWTRLQTGPVDEARCSRAGSTPIPLHNQISFGLRSGRFSVWLSEDFNPREQLPQHSRLGLGLDAPTS